jgi:S1-C subfamily serine protease
MSELAPVPEDFVDLVACLNAEAVDFIIVGAHALAIYGSPRATGDLDVLVRPASENAQRVFRALVSFGAPIVQHGLTIADFSTPGTVYQMGLPPHRIDILTEISGVTYDEASADATTAKLGSERARFIGLDAMIRNKRATGRTKDLADAEALEEIRARR